MIGNTGTGKSSIIQLLSGHETRVCSGAQRGTNESSIIQSKYEDNIYFIDTIGLQDCDQDWKDKKLLKKTLEYIHYQGLYRIKIILCVAGDTDTRKGLFVELSQFIGCLKVDNNDDENIKHNVWDSVLIIKKGDKTGVELDIDEFSGVMTAAMDNGAT